MKPAISDHDFDEPLTASVVKTVDLRRGFPFSSLTTLFWLTVRQHVRGWRLISLVFLFALPTVGALVARGLNRPVAPAGLENLLVFLLFPHVLLPLAALLHGSAMIQDEVEGQTLTYLLVRPLPRWSIYVTKLLATLLITIGLVVVFVPPTFLAIYIGQAGEVAVWPHIAKTVVLFSLALFAYCALFGAMSLFTQRSVVLGIGYIILFEGLLANFNFVIRQLTLVYYLRVLALRWVEVNVPDWKMEVSDLPSAGTAVLVLAGVGLLATFLAARVFATREFRMKTPEGS